MRRLEVVSASCLCDCQSVKLSLRYALCCVQRHHKLHPLRRHVHTYDKGHKALYALCQLGLRQVLTSPQCSLQLLATLSKIARDGKSSR